MWAVITVTARGSIRSNRPAAYRTFIGTRPMLRHAVDRALRLVPAERVLIVYDAEHRNCLEEALGGSPPGPLLEQPRGFGRAAAILLALTHVLERTPDACVAVMPADHFVHPEDKFLASVRQAHALALGSPYRVVMLEAVPYEGEASQLLNAAPRHAGIQRGRLLHTGMVVARAATLWEAAWQRFPHLVRRFGVLRHTIKLALAGIVPADQEALARAHVYQDLVPADLDFDRPSGAPDLVVALAMEGVLWDDWSQPGRPAQTFKVMRNGWSTRANPAMGSLLATMSGVGSSRSMAGRRQGSSPPSG